MTGIKKGAVDVGGGTRGIFGAGVLDRCMDLGIRLWLASIINPIFSGVPWPVFVFLVIVICVVFTNFLSNIAVAIMVTDCFLKP